MVRKKEKSRDNYGREYSKDILPILFEQFPITEQYYQKFIAYFNTNVNSKKVADYSFIYGKWMKNTLEDDDSNVLQNFTDKVKEAEEKPKTILKSNAVDMP